MKRFRIPFYILILLVLSFFASKVIRGVLVTDQVTRLNTNHFVITYQGIYHDEAEEVAARLEKDYDPIRKELRDPDHDTIKVFIHASQHDFNKATGLSGNSVTGTSRGPLEFHILWTNWYNSFFPDDPRATAVHEFTHCVQLNILIAQAMQEIGDSDSHFNDVFEKKFAESYPQWFWEALSLYMANESNSLSIKYAMRYNPTLKMLNQSNQIYNVGYTLIEYIVKTWGKDRLPALITTYADLEGVLNVSESEFEEGWRKFVSEHY